MALPLPLAGACIAWQSAPIAEGDTPMLSIELVKAANTLKDVSKKVAQFLSDAVIDLVD
ncbi:hypothetical protein [Hansschlegelia plantiphila]|uniref:Uncharacterized protein n=1 Tax=Hansschlegelia plantiphila TaxID=374655 RepID=A0A9W6J2T1_9HYPH|nr:hypothetical protein [Hansschlegelia plantiphila]GLK68255.1 hypothetical protein GCM10008179_18930 [Hansschlegelia plantiphila]